MLGKPAPLSPAEIELGKRSTQRGLILTVALLTAIAALLGGLFVLETQPPKVTLDTHRFAVQSLLYDEEFALTEVTHISLEDRIPRIRLRTNGSALGRTLRGHFRLDTLGDGQLFIERGFSPYLLVRCGSDYVIVNFEDPVRTRELHRSLTAKWAHADGDDSR